MVGRRSILAREAFDVALLDIVMPELDGLEVLKQCAPTPIRRKSSSSPARDDRDAISAMKLAPTTTWPA